MVSTIKAVRTTIELGSIELEVFQLPDGEYRLSQSQIALSVDLQPRDVIRFLKSDSPKALPYEELTISKAQEEGTRTTFNAIPIEVAVSFWGEIAESNSKAMSLLVASAIEAIERRADTAFGIQRTEEERNRRFKNRQEHRKGFHPKYTSWLKLDGIIKPRDYAKEVNRLKLCADLPLKPVNEYDADELWRLNEVESNYNMARKLGHSHAESLRYL